MKKNNILFIILGSLCCFLILTADTFAAGGDLLSVDKTIVIQFVIFLVALLVLNSLFFKPLLQLADKREQLTKGTVKEAKDLTEKAENVIEDYNSKIESARSEAVEKRAEIRKEAQTAAESMISEARAHSQSSLENYKTELDSHIEEVKEKIKPEIDMLAKDIASRVLGKEV